VGKVVKGVIIAGLILATAGAAAFIAPAYFASAAVWSIATNMATAAFLSGVSAQLASAKRPRPSQTVEYAGTVEPRRIIYGKVRVSGMHVIPPLTSGSDNRYLHTVLALAGHEVNAIGDVYFGQDLIESADITAITGDHDDGLVTDGAYEDRAWIRRYVGTSSQTADYKLTFERPSDWTSDHRLRGIAYGAMQFRLDDEVYKTGRPEVTFDVEGMKCYDPRLDSSPGAAPTNPSFIAYTTNPALCLANYLCGTTLGLGDNPANVDWAMVEEAADICDELVDVPTAATQARYTLNGSFYATERPEDVIQTIAGAMLGSCLMSGGRWRIRAGAWEAASFEITADDVMGPVDLETAYPMPERWNGIRGSFIDPENNYQTNEFPPVQNATYVSDDGESVFRDVAFPACTNVYEAQRLAIYLTRKSRNKQRAVIPCSLKLWKVRPGMTGIVTIAELGWTNKTVRCEAWGFTPDGLVALTVREELASDWDDPLEADYTEPLAISNPTPEYFTPAAPSGLTALDTIQGPLLAWNAPALMPSGAKFQVFEYTSNTPFSSASLVWTGIATTVVLPKTDQTTRYYWVRVITVDGVAGDEYPTAANGVAAARGTAGTTDIEDQSVTVTGASTGGSGSANVTGAVTNISSISVTNTDAVNARTVVMTVHGTWTYTSSAAPLSVGMRIAIETSNSSIGSVFHTIQPSSTFPAGTTMSGIASMERTFSLAAGATQVYYFNVSQQSPIGGGAPVFSLANVNLKYELILR
jgi:hypothetical protein